MTRVKEFEIEVVNGLTGEVLDISDNLCEKIIIDKQIYETGVTLYVVDTVKEMVLAKALELYRDTEKISFDEFLNNCDCCGGNWTLMLFTGIRRVFPQVYEIIPENEVYSFIEVCELLEILDVKPNN